MSYEYKYKGKHKVSVGGVGVVKKGDVFESPGKINHPDFSPQFEDEKPLKKEKTKK